MNSYSSHIMVYRSVILVNHVSMHYSKWFAADVSVQFTFDSLIMTILSDSWSNSWSDSWLDSWSV